MTAVRIVLRPFPLLFSASSLLAPALSEKSVRGRFEVGGAIYPVVSERGEALVRAAKDVNSGRVDIYTPDMSEQFGGLAGAVEWAGNHVSGREPGALHRDGLSANFVAAMVGELAREVGFDRARLDLVVHGVRALGELSERSCVHVGRRAPDAERARRSRAASACAARLRGGTGRAGRSEHRREPVVSGRALADRRAGRMDAGRDVSAGGMAGRATPSSAGGSSPTRQSSLLPGSAARRAAMIRSIRDRPYATGFANRPLQLAKLFCS